MVAVDISVEILEVRVCSSSLLEFRVVLSLSEESDLSYGWPLYF